MLPLDRSAACGCTVASLLLIIHTVPASASSPAAELAETLSQAVYFIAVLIGLLLLLPVVIVLYRRFSASASDESGALRVPEKDAQRLEDKGHFAEAAGLLAAGGEHSRAAALYEKAGDNGSAAEQYELAGEFGTAADLYLRSGGSVKAASLFIKTGNYLEAAKIYRNKGDHLRSAQSLELLGNKSAAAREFINAGRYDRAARLFKEEGLLDEAADAYGKFLKGRPLDDNTIEQYYGYAGLLARAGRREEAAEYYRSILMYKGDYRKTKGNLRALGMVFPSSSHPPSPAQDDSAPPPSPEQPEKPSPGSPLEEGEALSGSETDGLQKSTSLRNMIRYGKLDPRYSMKIWLQVLKTVSKQHEELSFAGHFSPDDIRIDMQNNVTIQPSEKQYPSYTAPEVLAGQAPGPHSDVYVLGVILYEMVTGSLEGLGNSLPSEKNGYVPPWLDNLILSCTKKDRRDRLMNLEKVRDELVHLKEGGD